jgi:hypothetical protein
LPVELKSIVPPAITVVVAGEIIIEAKSLALTVILAVAVNIPEVAVTMKDPAVEAEYKPLVLIEPPFADQTGLIDIVLL